tara:strand:- start:4752 stop:5126 length:375 start_codon:yes stop_codon:yes gene_type:complete
MARKKKVAYEKHEDYMKRRFKEEKTSNIISVVGNLSKEDVEGLDKAEKSYGDSWRQRGGIGAFMMLARKWDRLEKQVNEFGYDIFNAIDNDTRDEGILDDIRDLRRYLFLVEAHMRIVLGSQDD